MLKSIHSAIMGKIPLQVNGSFFSINGVLFYYLICRVNLLMVILDYLNPAFLYLIYKSVNMLGYNAVMEHQAGQMLSWLEGTF